MLLYFFLYSLGLPAQGPAPLGSDRRSPPFRPCCGRKPILWPLFPQLTHPAIDDPSLKRKPPAKEVLPTPPVQQPQPFSGTQPGKVFNYSTVHVSILQPSTVSQTLSLVRSVRLPQEPSQALQSTLLFHPTSDQPSANLLQINPYNQPHLQLGDQQLHLCSNYIPL